MTALFSFITIVLTFSRAGWISVVIGGVAMLFVYLYKLGVRGVLKGVASVLLVAIVGFAATAVDMVAHRLGTLSNIQEVSAFQSRLALWDAGINQIINNPLGHGAGAAGWNVQEHMGLGVDSNYIKFFLELGLFGGGGTVIFLLLLVVRLGKDSFKFGVKSSNRGVVALASFPILIMGLVQMITNQILEGYPSNLYYWFFLGMGVYGVRKNAEAVQ